VDDLADTVIDSAGNDTIRASANYTLATGLAIETLRVSGTTGRTLTGNELANALYGNIGVDHLIGGMGNDRLDGGLGADTLDGGDGNDTYIVDNAADVVIDSSGKDTIRATASYTLADDVAIEIMSVSGTDGLTLTGNNLANEIYGGVGNDHLVGAGGNDRLDGGLGVDTLDGGDGNDTYIVDNAADIVIDSSGKDTIRATASYTLADGVAIEIMSVSGVDGLTLTGNNLANEMYGGVGDDHLVGAGGNDRLDGGLGADTMDGGAGNDTFYVDDANDVVIDSSGKDTIRAKTSYTLADGVAIEVMRVSGTDGLHLTGNNLANEMYGGVGDDYLAGAGGNDRLEGGFGADTMEGGAGDDLYIVDDGGDWVIEAAGAGSGIDTVRASTSYELTANVENLLLTGTGDFEGWGNALNNALTGNGGHNVLDGGLGNDILNGGGGGDTFRFSTEPGTNNVDTIVAFDHAVDTIQFDSALFLAFPAGELEAGAFNTGTTATDEDDRVLFDAATGGLYYDADGVGGVEAVQFATILTVIGTLDHTDFFVT
jgi:Ca2+-binding RTX toxin-like protein